MGRYPEADLSRLVTGSVADGEVRVKGPKGNLAIKVPPGIAVAMAKCSAGTPPSFSGFGLSFASIVGA